MHAHMIARQATFAADMSARLRGTLAELEDLQGRQIQQLELQLEKVIEGGSVPGSSVAAGTSIASSTTIASGWRIPSRPSLNPYVQVLAAVCA